MLVEHAWRASKQVVVELRLIRERYEERAGAALPHLLQPGDELKSAPGVGKQLGPNLWILEARMRRERGVLGRKGPKGGMGVQALLPKSLQCAPLEHCFVGDVYVPRLLPIGVNLRGARREVIASDGIRVVVLRLAFHASKPEEGGSDDAVLGEERRRGLEEPAVLADCLHELSIADDARSAIRHDNLHVTDRNGRHNLLKPSVAVCLSLEKERRHFVCRRDNVRKLGCQVFDDASGTSRS
jgi:hypothetical protein